MRKKGFTLIELLIVIAIIAILATIVILNVLSARKKANGAKVLSEMNSAAKVASICLINQSILVYDGATEFPVGKDDRIKITEDTKICDDESVSPGNWPKIEELKIPQLNTILRTLPYYTNNNRVDFNLRVEASGEAVAVICSSGGCIKSKTW